MDIINIMGRLDKKFKNRIQELVILQKNEISDLIKESNVRSENMMKKSVKSKFIFYV